MSRTKPDWNNASRRHHRLESVENSEEYSYLADKWILNYYAAPSCFNSLIQVHFTSLHNETVNIFTHLFGGLYFLFQAFSFKEQNLEVTTTTTTITYKPIQIYCICASICFLSSGISHLLMGMGKQINDFFSQLDYAGITVLIWATSISLILLLLKADENSNNDDYYHWAIGLSTIVSGVSFAITIQPIQSKGIRVGIYSLACSSSIIPLLIQRQDPRTQEYIQHTLFRMMIWFGFGLFFYLSRFPERIFPGKFDLVFNSHNFWHCFVWLASYEHYKGLQVIGGH